MSETILAESYSPVGDEHINLIAFSVKGGASDQQLLAERFALARRALALANAPSPLTAEWEQEHGSARVELQACEIECRRRGLIR